MIVVDRIEEDHAVLDLGDGRTLDLPLSLLPPGIAEGDGLELVRRVLSTDEAEARLARLRARSPQGPGSIDL